MVSIGMPVDVDVIKRNYCRPALHTETQTNAFIVDLAVPLGVPKRVCKLVRRRYHIVDQTDLAQIEAARQMETQPFVLHLFGSQFQELDLGSHFQPDGRVSGFSGRQSHLRENDSGILAHFVQSRTCQSRDSARGAWYRIETA